MSAKNNRWALALMKLVFQNVPVPLVGDAAGILGSAVPGNFYVAAHTADPKLDGNQASYEASFGGYVRAAVERSEIKWSCILLDAALGPAQASNLVAIAFPKCSRGSAKITHLSVGVEATGPGCILYSGPLAEPRSVSSGIKLIIDPGDVILTEE